jgi:enoyl-CoA hydratase
VSEDTVLVEEPEEGVAKITLNRPKSLNAMNAELIAQLEAALGDVSKRKTCRVVILTGAGRGFCSGLDLKGFGSSQEQGGGATRGSVRATFGVQERIAGLVTLMRSVPQPIITAVNGPATGGGLALVMASDIRIASSSAKFNAAFIRIGLSACDIGTSWLLPRLVGAGRAHELMLTGRLFDAQEALRIGLVVEVTEDDELQNAAREKARLVMGNSPMGVRMTKEVMWSALEIPGIHAAMDLENRTQVMLSRTEDHIEALIAFLEKRKPEFKDR